MALRVSTGLRNHMLSGGSLKTGIEGGFIFVFGGAPYTGDADALVNLTDNPILYKISVGGDDTSPLHLDTAASAGQIVKSTSETWQSMASSTIAGTAVFWRWAFAGDSHGADTAGAYKRLQGAAATSNSELILSSTTIALHSVQTVDFFTISLPG
jgi:hypothetical protein